MRKIQVFICVFATIVVGCGQRDISERLTIIDSLVLADQYDSAYYMLESVDPDKIITTEDKAHYMLLEFQTNYLTQRQLLSDSILDCALAYYQEVQNTEKLADCFYYKGFWLAENKEYTHAITYLKKAEIIASSSKNLRQSFKILDAISRINNFNGNYNISLKYGKMALVYAKRASRKDWVAYSYFRIGLAFINLEKEDSALYYFDKTSPLIKYVRKEDVPFFLSNLSLVYLKIKPEMSKELLLKSLSYKPLISSLEQLAEIYYDEGNRKEAYRLWSKALTINDLTPKDNIIHNLLEYDVEHGKTDEVCQRVNEIIAIKDSIITKLKNDTIRDLQIRFDHEVAMNAVNRKLIWWQTCLGIPAIILLILTIIWIKKQHRTSEELHHRETEIKNLIGLLDDKKNQVLSYENQIAQLEKEQHEGSKKIADQLAEIQQLRMQREAAEEECRVMTQRIENWADAEAEKVRRGALLINELNENKPVRHWSDEMQEAIIAYYCTLHKNMAAQIKNRKRNLTIKQIMYLILCDMKKNKKEISAILGVDMNTLRTYKFRITKKE